MKETREIRSAIDVEIDNRIIKGYALTFNTVSELLPAKGLTFRETVREGAIDGLIDKCDIVALYQHESDAGVLARSRKGKGTLTLMVDTKGLYFEFEAPETSLGDAVLSGIRRGDLDGCSFAFTVADKGDKWTRQADGTYLREISKIAMLEDISVVVFQAYKDSTVINTRGLEIAEEEELNNYYNLLKLELTK